MLEGEIPSTWIKEGIMRVFEGKMNKVRLINKENNKLTRNVC